MAGDLSHGHEGGRGSQIGCAITSEAWPCDFPPHGFCFMKKVSSADSLGPDSTDSKKNNLRKSVKSVDDSKSLPNSRKVYVSGKLNPDIRVPFREISLAPTKTMSGEIEGSAGASPVLLPNEPVRVYDTGGPWGDGDFAGDVEQGLPALRAKWIRDRAD